jgi:hypothetical protein
MLQCTGESRVRCLCGLSDVCKSRYGQHTCPCMTTTDLYHKTRIYMETELPKRGITVISLCSCNHVVVSVICSDSLEQGHCIMRESMRVVHNINIEYIDFMIAVSNVVCHLSRVPVPAHRAPPKSPPRLVSCTLLCTALRTSSRGCPMAGRSRTCMQNLDVRDLKDGSG